MYGRSLLSSSNNEWMGSSYRTRRSSFPRSLIQVGENVYSETPRPLNVISSGQSIPLSLISEGSSDASELESKYGPSSGAESKSKMRSVSHLSRGKYDRRSRQEELTNEETGNELLDKVKKTTRPSFQATSRLRQDARESNCGGIVKLHDEYPPEAGRHRRDAERRFLKSVPLMKQAREQGSLEKRSEVRVVVVGAGMAGLTIANGLLKNGFVNTTILEGSNRTGGRIHTVYSKEDTKDFFELGVSEIDYPQDWNTVYRLAKMSKLMDDTENSRRGESSACLREADTCLKRHIHPYCEMINNEITTLGSMNTNSTDSTNAIELSSKEYFRETLHRLNKTITGDAKEKLLPKTPFLSSALEAFCNDMRFKHGDTGGGADIQKFGPVFETSPVSVPLGMASLIPFLTKNFKKDTVQYKANVTFIDWSSFTVKNDRNGCDPMATIVCSDGRIFKAHHVIVTMPLGHLKLHAHTLFNPPLPEYKLRAIENIGFGSVCKILLKFERPVTSYGFSFVWPRNDDDKLDFDYNIVSNGKISFAAKPRGSVVQVIFLKDEPEVLDSKHLPQYLTRILQIVVTEGLPKLLKFKKTSWDGNPLYQGTHPYVKLSGSLNDMNDLAQPLMFRSRPVIQFAGDGTFNDYKCLLHGARASGLREVKRLTNLYDDLFGWQNSNHIRRTETTARTSTSH